MGDGDVGVVGPDGFADCGGEQGCVLGAAHDEVTAVGWIVPVGEVDHVDGCGAKGVFAGIGDDADDCEAVILARELATKWVLAGPYGFGGGLRDDGILQVAVAGVEFTAFEDVLANCGEVIGADPAIVCKCAGAHGLVGACDAVDPALAFEEHATDHGGGLDAG